MVRKVRHVIEGPLPDGPLGEGEVILAPVRRFRWLAVRWMALRTMISAWRRSIPAMSAIVRGDQSLRTKLERAKAELLLEATSDIYCPQNLHRHGFRKGICECSEGLGHRRS